MLCPFPAFGHGIGLTFGKPYIREGDTTILRPGMVIAIEANYGPRLLSGLAQD